MTTNSFDFLNFQLWTAKECAIYLGVQYKSFLNCTQYMDGFPKRCRNEGAPRWIGKEIMEWRPMENGTTYLYRHYDGNDNLLYVGISLSPRHRTKSHKKESHWFDDVRKIIIEKHESRFDAKKSEFQAIQKEKPKYNIRMACNE